MCVCVCVVALVCLLTFALVSQTHETYAHRFDVSMRCGGSADGLVAVNIWVPPTRPHWHYVSVICVYMCLFGVFGLTRSLV